MTGLRQTLTWAIVAVVLAVPCAFALTSPLLQWRQPVYIVAGFAGVVGLALMLLQPLLVTGLLPGLRAMRGRRAHRFVGGALVLAVVTHVVGLWITSPPDVIDALTFTSPTPFSAWGVIAMWAVFAAALLAVLRRKVGMRLAVWRIAHSALALLAVLGTAVHAVQIDGTMEPVSKTILVGLVLIVTVCGVAERRGWLRVPRRG